MGRLILLFVFLYYPPTMINGHTKPVYGPPHSTNAVEQHGYAMRHKRQVPEGMLDPYSVLGFLSFATFLFCILYNRHKMKPNEKTAGGGGQQGGSAGQVPPIAVLTTLDFQKLVEDMVKKNPTDLKKLEGLMDGDDEDDYEESREVDKKSSSGLAMRTVGPSSRK